MFFHSQQLMLMAVLNCLFDSLSQMLRYVLAAVSFYKTSIKLFFPYKYISDVWKVKRVYSFVTL